MAGNDATARFELSERLRFETLLADISARFVSVLADHVDEEIVEAQRRLCACMEVDLSSVWQPSASDDAIMCLTHLYRPPEVPAPPDRLTADSFPWVAGQVLAGLPVAVRSMVNLPPEAARDRETWAYFGIKSSLALPLSAGGGPVLGVLAFATVRSECEWPEAMVNRCRIVAQVFANALARKHADGALRQSEERFRTIAMNLPGVVYQFYARDGGGWGMRYVDAQAERICGLCPEPLASFFDRFKACVGAEDRERFMASIKAAIAAGSAWEQTFRFIQPSGKVVHLRCFSKPMRVGDVVIFNGVMRDITEQTLTEMAMAESERRYRTLFESAPVGIVLIGPDGCVQASNPAQARLYGYASAEKLQGYYTPLFVAEKDRARAKQNLQDQLQGLDVPPRTYTLVRRDGSEFIGEVTSAVLRGPQREVQGYLCTTRDITALVRAQEDLKRAVTELNGLKERLQQENVYLCQEIHHQQSFENILGQSLAIEGVLRAVEQVAPTESTVLIQGETGTGKELIARAIHMRSARHDRVMVKVNCAALPATLVEAELFGREKGAYTGALSRQPGRFELADKSTLLLDEVGELPPEIQAKLLRVLQDGHFERLGSSKSIHTDVRIVAATNKDLSKAVAGGRFRSDLYYRLNVFPILVPPLRDRREDIPQLVWAFVKEFSQRMGKPVTSIPNRDLETLQAYAWPGNVRELRNVVERAMILYRGETLHIELPHHPPAEPADPIGLNFCQAQRRHILDVLERTGFRIRGVGGAAELLGVKPTTLESRMARLGITRTVKDSE